MGHNGSRAVETNKIYRARALDLLSRIGDGGVDLVFYDPPYNVGKVYGTYSDDLPPEEYLSWMGKVAGEALRVSRRGVGIYLSWQLLEDFWREVLPGADLLIIHKRSSGAITSKRGIMQHHHGILTTAPAVYKVKSVWTDLRLPGEGYLFREERFAHPAQTSLAATRRYLERFSERGDLVADPFSGTGTTAVAARMLDRRHLGAELNPDYLRISSGRLRQRRMHDYLK
jgi:site-specific DNA-methyltransferase (adenine-specific)